MRTPQYPDTGGKYEIIRPLGRGGMGTVYLARDPRLKREVAIKVLREDLPRGDWRQRMGEEAQLLARLNHPNIVQIYDIIDSADAPALVMEYVRGRNLHIHLRERRVELADRLRWLGEIAAGLAASHEAGVVHCDLKAENVLISSDGTAKVTDFGIAIKGGDRQDDVGALGALAAALLEEYRPLLSPAVSLLLGRLHSPGEISAADAAVSFRSAWYEQTQSETPLPGELAPPSSPGKNKLLLPLALLLLMALAVFAWYQRPAPSPRWVAVLPPGMESPGALTERQRQFLRAQVQQSLQEAVIADRQLALISQREAAELPAGGVRDTLAALGADMLISASLACADLSCELLLERIDGPGGNVAAKRTVALLAETPLDNSAAIRRQWRHLLPESTRQTAAAELISEADYARYIELSLALQNFSVPTVEILRATGEIIGRAPEFPPLYTVYADAALLSYEELGDRTRLDDLDARLAEAARRFGVSLSLLRSEFMLSLYREDFGRAEQIIGQIARDFGEESLLAFLRGELFDRQSQFDGALRHYRRAASLRPNMRHLYTLARTHYRLGQGEDATRILEQLLRRYPYNTHALQLLSVIELESGDLAAGIALLERSLAILPNAMTRTNLGTAYLASHDYEAAREQFETAYREDSRDAALVLNLADAEQQLGNTARSDALYTSLIERHQDGDLSVLPMAAAQAYAQLGRYQEALSILRTLEQEGTNAAFNASAAALVYTLAGQKLMALVEFDNALDRGLSALWFNMVWYDGLCTEAAFRARMRDSGYPERCQAIGD